MCDVVVVDDDPLVCATLAAILDGEGWRVREAASGAEAMAAMAATDSSGACRLLVADIDLGSAETGFGVAARVRQLHPGVPVVFVSGRPDLLSGRAPAADERLLAKPFRSDDLLRAVRELLSIGSNPD